MAREIVIRGRAVTTHSSNVVDTKSRRREFRQGELAVSDTAVTESRAARLGRPYGAVATWEAPDTRRVLQLGLSGLWLLDAILQYQSFMFTRAFGQMLTASAAGNPAVVGRPITWAARLVEQHGSPLNTTFATVQLLLALGIAWRPTLKAALAASIAWSLSVWWLGEGLGGVLTGRVSPVSGAPGAVILYALLAVLLWPADRAQEPAPFVAARALGARASRALWLVLWASLAYFSLLPASRSAQGLHNMISGMAAGEPGWLAAADKNAAALLAQHGLAASVALAVVLVVIAAGVYLPAPAARAAIVLAVVVAAAIWVFGEALGTIFTGSGTDPDSGPLLALLALAYWPARAQAPARARRTAQTVRRAAQIRGQ
jgi:hypothetical protein